MNRSPFCNRARHWAYIYRREMLVGVLVYVALVLKDLVTVLLR